MIRVNKNETLANFKQPDIRSEKSRGLTEVSENKRAPISESYLRGFLKDTAELIDSQPTVGNAWKKYWSEREVNNIDDYQIKVTTKHVPFIQIFSPNPQVESEEQTLSAFDYVAQNDHNHLHEKVFNKNVPLSSSESKNILSKLNDFKLPEYQKELQEHYFEENTGKIKNFANQYPELAVIAAINKGTIPENSMNILSSVENGNGEVLLPNLGPYGSSSLVMLRDNDSQQSLLISMNPLQTGSNVSHFDNNTKMQRFFKNEKNEEFILSHFNLYNIQDGVLAKGAEEHLDNVQHSRKEQYGAWFGSSVGVSGPRYKWEPALDMEFMSFSQLNNKYGDEYVNRLKTQFTNNADVLTVSDSERKTKQGLEIAKPIIDGLSIAISPFFPIAGVGAGLLSGIGIPAYQALTADTQDERDTSSFDVLTNLLIEGFTNIPVAGVGQAVRRTPKPEGELPSFRPHAPESVSHTPIKDNNNPFGYDLPTIKEKPEVLVSNQPPSNKPQQFLKDENGDVVQYLRRYDNKHTPVISHDDRLFVEIRNNYQEFDIDSGRPKGDASYYWEDNTFKQRESLIDDKLNTPISNTPLQLSRKEMKLKQKAIELESNDGGHSIERHGPEVSNKNIKSRIRTGTAPDGMFSSSLSSSKFNSYESWTDTRAKVFSHLFNNTGNKQGVAPLEGSAEQFKYTVYHPKPIGQSASGFGDIETVKDSSYGQGGRVITREGEVASKIQWKDSHVTQSTISWNKSKEQWVLSQHFPAVDSKPTFISNIKPTNGHYVTEGGKYGKTEHVSFGFNDASMNTEG